MLRLLIRLSGLAALAAGFAQLVVDGTRSIAAGWPMPMRLGEVVEWALPGRLAALEPAVAGNLHPLLWDPALTLLLAIPAGIVFVALGLFLLVALRPREPAIAMPVRR